MGWTKSSTRASTRKFDESLKVYSQCLKMIMSPYAPNEDELGDET